MVPKVHKINKGKGIFMGLLIGLVFFVPAIWGINFSLSDPEDLALRLVLLIPTVIILVLYLYLYFGLLSMKYITDDQGLTIVWNNKRYRIPWQEITEMHHSNSNLNFVNILGVSWPGYIAGMYIVKGIKTGKVFATDNTNLLMISMGSYSFGITPSPELIKVISEKTNVNIESVDYYDLPEEEIGPIPNEDLPFLLLYALNVITLIGLAAYLAIFYPGSGADRKLWLLLVLGMGVFAFNLANASRFFNYMRYASYFIWFIGITINMVFLVLAINQL